jgi:exopolysaccharide production protein ExoQ
MPSELFLVLTLAFILFLFRRESRYRRKVSAALWIPLIWFLIAGSRFVSAWFDLRPASYRAAIEDGSPIDATVFLCLILSGIYVLKQRHVTIAKFFRSNRWLTLFLLFCLISALWSEFPFIAFKRWIKVLGHAVMILIVLTDPDPFEAMRTLLKRVGFVLVPLSILLINCYPRWGQGFDPVTGEPSYTGAATDKNALGHLCMIVGIFFFWNVLQAFKIKNRTVRRNELCLSVLLLGLTCWLLKMSSSATSLVTFVVGVLTIGFLGIRFVDKRRVGIYLLAGIFAFAAAESLFGIYENLVPTLGRNLDLTDRTELWPNLLKLQPNPIFGAGFESFWMGQRLDELWARYSWYPNEAHNGYLEIYLSLGIIGVGLFAGVIIETFRKIRRELLSRVEVGRLRLGFFLAILVYNYTEAAFVSLHLVYAAFFLIAVEYPMARRLRPRRLAETTHSKAEESVVSVGADIDGSRIRHFVY